MLENFEGRIGDTFINLDGNKISSRFLTATFNGLAHPSISQYQIVQKSLSLTIVRMILADKVPQSILDQISQLIRDALGNNVEVTFEIVKEIPPLPSGKHQFLMSEVKKP